MEYSKEIELKLLLNNEGYETIKNLFIVSKPSIIQENFYFDTNTCLLRNNKITLRIRKEFNNFSICFKVKNKGKEQYIRESSEYTISITEEEFFAIIKNPDTIKSYFSCEAKKIFNSLNIDQETIILLGSIRNVRNYLKGLFGYTFELDITTFPNNITEYELEIENINSEDKDNLLKKLYDVGIKVLINEKSKYERFIDALRCCRQFKV